jgi:hypothetical protein
VYAKTCNLSLLGYVVAQAQLASQHFSHQNEELPFDG